MLELLEQVQVTELQHLDLRGLLADQVRIVVDDALLVLGEEGGDPPLLVADLDGAVIAHLDLHALAPGVGQGVARSALADDTSDLLAGHHRLALGVDVVEADRHIEREVRFGRDDRLAVLAGAHHVEPAFAVRSKVDDGVATRRFIHTHSPLLVRDLHCPLSAPRKPGIEARCCFQDAAPSHPPAHTLHTRD